jgi:hypothetical protein
VLEDHRTGHPKRSQSSPASLIEQLSKQPCSGGDADGLVPRQRPARTITYAAIVHRLNRAGWWQAPVVPGRKRMRRTPTLLTPDIRRERDPLATIAVSAAPVVLEGRYRLLMQALWQLRHSRRTRWGLGAGSVAVMLVLAFLTIRHFASTSWPLSRGKPGLLVAAGLLLFVAQALKALGWATVHEP